MIFRNEKSPQSLKTVLEPPGVSQYYLGNNNLTGCKSLENHTNSGSVQEIYQKVTTKTRCLTE